MNVLIVGIRADHRDGWGKYCALLLNALASSTGAKVKLATNEKEAGLSRDLSAFQVRSNRRLNVRKRELLWDVLRFSRYWRAADAIIAADELSAPLCALAARIFNKRLITVVHGTYALLSLDCKKADTYRKAFVAADAIVAVSNYTKARLAERLPVVADKIRAVSLSAVSDSIARPAQQPADNHFCVIGGIKPRKGALHAVKALDILLKKGRDVRLIVIGEQSHDDAYFQEVMREVARAGMEDRISFTGFVSEIEKNTIVATSIANLLPSENVGGSFEGFGFVHLEAGFFAVPTIGSRSCGNEDAIRDGETGYLLKQGDVSGLSDRMDALSQDTALRSRLGLNGQEFVFGWTWRDIAETYDRLLRS